MLELVDRLFGICGIIGQGALFHEPKQFDTSKKSAIERGDPDEIISVLAQSHTGMPFALRQLESVERQWNRQHFASRCHCSSLSNERGIKVQ